MINRTTTTFKLAEFIPTFHIGWRVFWHAALLVMLVVFVLAIVGAVLKPLSTAAAIIFAALCALILPFYCLWSTGRATNIVLIKSELAPRQELKIGWSAVWPYILVQQSMLMIIVSFRNLPVLTLAGSSIILFIALTGIYVLGISSKRSADLALRRLNKSEPIQ